MYSMLGRFLVIVVKVWFLLVLVYIVLVWVLRYILMGLRESM